MNLTASLRERGMIQPIVARPVRGAPDAFEIIAGERRWRAAQRAGLHEVPVVIIEATDEESLQLAIIENVQRADLNPLEEAEGYRALVEDYSHTQDDIAKMVGKSRSHVANTLRLLKLPPSIRAYIFKGKLDAGHARMLVGQPNAEKLAEEIVARGLNVRQVEEIARQEFGRNGKPHSAASARRKRTPTRWRWKNVCPTRSVWSSTSMHAAKAASSASAIAISISSTIWRSAWRKSSIKRRRGLIAFSSSLSSSRRSRSSFPCRRR